MKKVMEKAWRIAKEAAEKFGGRAIEYIAMALKEAWKEIKAMGKDIMDRIPELESMGFHRWQKNGMDRMYINASDLGLTCWYYKSGNISSAEFNGEIISNTKARGLKFSKTYIDLIKRKLVSESETLLAAAAELIGVEYNRGTKIVAL